MVKWIGFEIIAEGKMDDYEAWWEARDKRLQELGLARLKMYQVDADTRRSAIAVHWRLQPAGKVFFEGPEQTPEEEVHWQEQYHTDEVIEKLRRERREKGVVVEGTTEMFRLITD